MSFGFAFEIIVETNSEVMLGEIDAVACKRFVALLQSPSLPSYNISNPSSFIVNFSASAILVKYF
jgi:hypothetical protein